MKILCVLLLIAAVQTCNSNNHNDSNIVQATDIIKELEKGADVFYENVTISGDLDFTVLKAKYVESPMMDRAHVKGSFTLINCTIKGSIIGYKMQEKIVAVDFDKNFSLINCKVEGEVNIREGLFGSTVNCSKTAFKGRSTFEGSFFQANVNFNNAIFLEEARFHNCFFNWKVNFLEADFAAVCGFQGATFNSDAQFSNIKCSGYADFTLLNFNAGAFFNYADFQDRAAFGASVFKDRCDFNNAIFTHHADFKEARFQGQTRFNDTEILTSLSFESALFLSGKPEIASLEDGMEERIEWKDARVAQFE